MSWLSSLPSYTASDDSAAPAQKPEEGAWLWPCPGGAGTGGGGVQGLKGGQLGPEKRLLRDLAQQEASIIPLAFH